MKNYFSQFKFRFILAKKTYCKNNLETAEIILSNPPFNEWHFRFTSP